MMNIESDAKVCGNCRWWMPDPTDQGRAGMPDQCGACPQSYNDELDFYDVTHANFECMYKYHPEEGRDGDELAFEPKEEDLGARYNRLANVAKDLLGLAHSASEGIMIPSAETVDGQRRKLECLGVVIR